MQKFLKTVAKALIVIALLFGYGFYLSVGLDLTTRTGSALYGPAYWLIWMFSPVIVGLMFMKEYS